MNRNHTLKNSSDISLKARCGNLAMVLIVVFAVGFNSQPAAGQRTDYGKPREIPAGFDLFQTVSRTTWFQFREEFTIPAGFFDEGSKPFAGTVNFKGVPLGSFRDQKTGNADTIVERTKAATFNGSRGSAVVPIEVVALSLESARPIRVQVGRQIQLWNVKIELSPSRKSGGTMTIARRGDKGGTFSSEFVVYALFTFTRPSDGAQKTLDVGKMDLSRRSIEKITLRASSVAWVSNCRGSQSELSGGFCAGVGPGSNRQMYDENGRLAQHGIMSALS